jgi:hypothetical protein
MFTHADFLALVDQYHLDTRFKSYHDTKHTAFQELLSHGKDIIPFILKELYKRDSWLPINLLSFIVGHNPHITNDMRGDSHALTDAWIKWAEDNGYDKYMVLF